METQATERVYCGCFQLSSEGDFQPNGFCEHGTNVYGPSAHSLCQPPVNTSGRHLFMTVPGKINSFSEGGRNAE